MAQLSSAALGVLTGLGWVVTILAGLIILGVFFQWRSK